MTEGANNGTLDEIFLHDESIANWRQPVPEGSVWMGNFNASTELVEDLGAELVQENIGPYLVSATSAKYRAIIQRRNNDSCTGENPNPTQEEILFSGGITILEDGIIPGTNLTGSNVRRVGKIWTASAGGEKSLREIILGREHSEYAARIAAILRGYDKKEEEDKARKLLQRKLESMMAWR